VSASLNDERGPSDGLRWAWSDRLPSGWDDWVERSVGGSFAARAGFLEALPLALPGSALVLLTVHRGERLVGAVPISVVRRWGRRWAYSLPFGTYGGPLVEGAEIDPSGPRAELATAFAAWLEGERVLGGDVVRVPCGESAPDLAWSSLAAAVLPSTAYVVSLAGRSFEEYESSLRHETKKGLRHARRDEVMVREEPAALSAAYALYRSQAQSWRGHRPYPLEFLQALLDHPSRFARLFTARRGTDLLCAILGLSCGDEVFLWWSGSSPESRRTLAYPHLIVEIVRVAAGEGRQRVNIGSSGAMAIERFKQSLGAEPTPVWTYRLAPRATDPASRLLVWVKKLVRRG